MSTINKSLAYTDGDTLDTDGHNKNIFSTDLNEGIMSVSNGGLDDTNLASDFTVKAQHVAPEAAVRVRADWKMETLDFNTDSASSNSDNISYVPVAGTAARIYLPYSPSLVWWQWSMFVTPWRWNIYDTNASSTRDRNIVVVAYHVDPAGTETRLSHTRRVVPISAALSEYGTVTGTSNVKARQARNSLLYDQAHLLGQPSAGWHEVQVRLYMEYYNDAENVVPNGAEAWLALYQAYLHDRVSFGICNSRVMSLL